MGPLRDPFAGPLRDGIHRATERWLPLVHRWIALTGPLTDSDMWPTQGNSLKVHTRFFCDGPLRASRVGPALCKF